MVMKWFLIGILVVSVLVGSITKIEPFDSAPVFMTKQQTYGFIREDSDKYIGSMPLMVVEKRGFPDHESYLRTAAKTALSFSTRDERFLSAMAPEIDRFLVKHYGAKKYKCSVDVCIN